MADVKISANNQTLILAGERPGWGNSSLGSVIQTAGSSAAVLQRLTIVASQPNALLYLRADYSPVAVGVADDPLTASEPVTYGGQTARSATNFAGDTSTAASLAVSPGALQSVAPAAQLADTGAQRDAFGNAFSRDSGVSIHASPAERYARTQRLLTDMPRMQRIDVHA